MFEGTVKPWTTNPITDEVIVRFEEKVDRTGIHHLWTAGADPRGYGHFWFVGSMRGAHEVAWVIYHGPIPEGLNVLHRCDIGLCVKEECLFLGTQLVNVQDMDSKNRRGHGTARGEAAHAAKLTAEMVREARVRYAAGASIAQLSRDYGVTGPTMGDAVKGLSWAHVV